MNLFGKKRRPGWLCLNFRQDRVDLSHVLVAGKPRPEILLCESFRKEGSDSDTLKRLRRELGLDRYHCMTMLQPRDYQLLTVDAPNVPAAEAKTAVRWAIKDMVDFPVETAMVDAVHVPGGDGAGRAPQMLAVVARNDLIATMVQPFNDADVELSVIDVPELAQRNLASLLEEEGRGLALLCIDNNGALLTFTSGGELYQSRSIDVSLRDFESGANTDELFDRLALELQRSLDHFDRQYRNIAVQRIVVSQVQSGDRLVEYLNSNLTLPVVALDLERIMDFPGVPELRDPLRQSQCLQLIGAAMRAEAVTG
ncbi:MAG: agglutinin biogenesis protein MshI [Burkholderiales bacterium]